MSSRTALIALLALVAAFFAPMVLRGRVISAHDNHVELGDPSSDPRFAELRQTRGFIDHSAFYIPEIHHHLHGDRTSWLSTWNPHVELGRPSSHVSGFSPAFVVTRVLSWFTSDAYVLYTALTILTIALTAAFAFAFLDAIGLHPWAAFAGAAGIALGVFAIYWLTFVMFASGLCWTLGIAWLVTRFLERPTLARGAGIAFCVHALLLTAYPQQIVWHGYLLALYALACWWRTEPRAFARLGALLTCVLLGFALAAPVYADLALAASRSTRIGADAAYFLPALPIVDSWRGLAEYFALLVDAFQIGNPIDQDYPARFNGLCLTPFYAALVLVAALEGGWRRTGIWLAFALVCLVLTLWSDAYLFGVKYLGLSLSRFTPLAAALIPSESRARSRSIARCARVFAGRSSRSSFAGIAPVMALAFVPGDRSRLATIAIVLLFAGFAALVWTRKSWLVPALVVASVAFYSTRLDLARPPEAIAKDSVLVERVREMTKDGSRYAFVGQKAGAVPSAHEEALVGLRSIHTYDSLSSRIYQEWVERISTIRRAHFRPALRAHRRRVAPWKCGRRAGERLDVREHGTAGQRRGRAERRGRAVPAVPRESAAHPRALGRRVRARRERSGDDDVDRTARPVAEGAAASEIVEEHDDRFALPRHDSDRAMLLFVSRQYHPHWTATGGKLVRVNGVFLGVLRCGPRRARSCLEFRPWTRWMWVSQAVMLVAAIVLVIRARRGTVRPLAA
jgi:hypothetical protein